MSCGLLDGIHFEVWPSPLHSISFQVVAFLYIELAKTRYNAVYSLINVTPLMNPNINLLWQKQHCQEKTTLSLTHPWCADGVVCGLKPILISGQGINLFTSYQALS